jgi:hypothetical protein
MKDPSKSLAIDTVLHEVEVATKTTSMSREEFISVLNFLFDQCEKHFKKKIFGIL